MSDTVTFQDHSSLGLTEVIWLNITANADIPLPALPAGRGETDITQGEVYEEGRLNAWPLGASSPWQEPQGR